MNTLSNISKLPDLAGRQARRLATGLGEATGTAREATLLAAQSARYQLDRLEGASTVAGALLRRHGARGARLAVAGARTHPAATGAILLVAAAAAALAVSPRLRQGARELADKALAPRRMAQSAQSA